MKNKIITFEITNQCNLKCRMCGIWKEKTKKSLSLDIIRDVLESGIKFKTVCLTGGEPFMVDVGLYYNLIREILPKAHINISSNGYFTENILDFIKKNPTNISITISYDGKNNDIIRGIPNSGEKALLSAKILKENNIDVRLKLTTDGKVDIKNDIEYMKNMNIPILFKLEENLICHHSRNMDKIEDKMLCISNFKGIDVENKKYLRKCINKISGRKIKCSWDQVFITSEKDVYLCRRRNPIGNLLSMNFRDIMLSENKVFMQKIMKNCNDFNCFSFSHK